MFKSNIVIQYQVCVCCILLKANTHSFLKLSEVIFNFMLSHKFIRKFLLQKSFTYKRNHWFYNKVISAFFEKIKCLKSGVPLIHIKYLEKRKKKTSKEKEKTNTFSVTSLCYLKMPTYFIVIPFRDKVFWRKASFTPATLYLFASNIY